MKRLFQGLYLSCIPVLVGPPASAPAADWPAFGRDRTRNAVSTEDDDRLFCYDGADRAKPAKKLESTKEPKP